MEMMKEKMGTYNDPRGIPRRRSGAAGKEVAAAAAADKRRERSRGLG